MCLALQEIVRPSETVRWGVEKVWLKIVVVAGKLEVQGTVRSDCLAIYPVLPPAWQRSIQVFLGWLLIGVALKRSPFHLSGMPIGRQKKSSTYFCIIPYQNEKSYSNFILHFEAWAHTMINKLVLSQSSSNSICWPQSQFFSVFDLIPITS